jgi:tRNA(Ile)-lysidine synthase
MKGKQKISDFLVQQKVPLHRKKKVFVVVSGETICWVVGYRISEDFRWKKSSKQALHLAFRDK